MGLRFIEDGYRTEVFEADGSLEIGAMSAGNRQVSADLLISRLTDLRPRRTFSLRYALESMAAEQTGELLVAVVGRLSADDAHGLLRTKRSRTTGLAMVLDVDSFARAGHAANGSKPDERGPSGNADLSDLSDDLQATVRLLRSDGWRVVVVGRGMTVADAWAALDPVAGRRGPPTAARTPTSPSDQGADPAAREPAGATAAEAS
jgi:hypothetical protein